MPAAKQLSLDAGLKARDRAIAQVEANADAKWLEAAWTCLLAAKTFYLTFTTDSIWDLLARRGTAPPHEPRAMGAIMRRAVDAGLIEQTGEYRKSHRRECHARPIPVWRRRQ